MKNNYFQNFLRIELIQNSLACAKNSKNRCGISSIIWNSSLYYWARRYGAQLKPRENYNKLRKTIAILITDYEIPNLKWFKDAHTIWKLLEKRNPNIKIFEDIEIHIIEMPKIEVNPKATEKGLKNWIRFLQSPESETVKIWQNLVKKKIFSKLLTFLKRLYRIKNVEKIKRKER